jgi:hypothetical protein
MPDRASRRTSFYDHIFAEKRTFPRTSRMKTINGPGHIARGVSSCRSTPMRSLQNDKVCSPTAPGANSTPPRCRQHCIQQSTMDMRPRHRALAGRLGHFDCSTTLTTWINETNQRASTQLAQWNLVITTPGHPTTVHPNPPTSIPQPATTIPPLTPEHTPKHVPHHRVRRHHARRSPRHPHVAGNIRTGHSYRPCAA